MKKYKYITLLLISFSLSACGFFYPGELNKMNDAVRQHIRNNDKERKIQTNVEFLNPISYEEIPKDKRGNPDEVYLFKTHLRGTWSYYTGNRIYNTDDTLQCYFNKDKVFIRVAK